MGKDSTKPKNEEYIKRRKREQSMYFEDNDGGHRSSSESPIPEPAYKWDDDKEESSMDSFFAGKTRKELLGDKSKPPKEKEFNLLDKPGQSSRELNPFWKDGGTGLPPEKSESSRKPERSRRERRDYSSDSKSSLSESSGEEAAARKSGKKVSSSSSKSHKTKRKDDKGSKSEKGGRNVHERSRQSQKLTFRRPNEDSSDSEHEQSKGRSSYQDRKKLSFKKPDEEETSVQKAGHSSSGKKNWKKSTSSEQTKQASARYVPEHRQQNDNQSKDIPQTSVNKEKVGGGALSLNQMNELSASILKAELMGNKVLAEELKAKLKEARLNKEASSSGSEIYDEKGRKVVILTETDSKGFTRPLRDTQEERQYSKSKKKASTHEGNKRVRYFADDDKYSLNEMFEKEKYSSTDEQNATFIKLAGKYRKNDDMDDEEVYDLARHDDSAKDDERKRKHAVNKHRAQAKALDNCKYCITNNVASNDCIVLTKEKVYLAVPSFQSLTDRHCLIIPQYHVPCATMLDEDIWEEIMELRKLLVRTFEKDDEDIIFFESAFFINNHPHMVLHCVPVPREIGDTAPIFFKKAILECESEWSNNKKVVELAGRDVRKAVPKGLPYFAVDFGLQSGYAHVIEDKKLFSHNFGQEIIGGMLDLDHTIWRKPKRDSEENIRKKVKLLKESMEEE